MKKSKKMSLSSAPPDSKADGEEVIDKKHSGGMLKSLLKDSKSH